MKIQILITDIPKEKFTQDWPKTIETLLFETKFPELKTKLQYFTPLPFLQRIVIILNDSKSALKLYEFLKDGGYVNKPMKLFLTKSLLIGSSPKPHSFGDSSKDNSGCYDKTTTPFLYINKDKTNPNKNTNEESRGNVKSKPILSLETNPLKTGITLGSLSLGSPSLSPDNSSLESPTLIKFGKKEKLHYYREPLPRMNSSSSFKMDQNISITPVASKQSDCEHLDVNSKTSDNEIISPLVNTPQKSPTITINPVFP